MLKNRILAGAIAALAGTAAVGSAQADGYHTPRHDVPVYKPGPRYHARAAVAAHAPRYVDPVSEPVFISPPPAAIYAAPGPECFETRKAVWLTGWGWDWRPITICHP